MQVLLGFSQVTTLSRDWQPFYQITWYFINLVLNEYDEWVNPTRTTRCVHSENIQTEPDLQAHICPFKPKESGFFSRACTTVKKDEKVVSEREQKQ